jgi:hypothetical protein
MGLKGYRLWVMGQLDSNVQRPTTERAADREAGAAMAAAAAGEARAADDAERQRRADAVGLSLHSRRRCQFGFTWTRLGCHRLSRVLCGGEMT